MTPSERSNGVLARGLVELLVFLLLDGLGIPHPKRFSLVQSLESNLLDLLSLRLSLLDFLLDLSFVFVVGNRGGGLRGGFERGNGSGDGLDGFEVDGEG